MGILETMRAEAAGIPLWPEHRARLVRCGNLSPESLAAIESAVRDLLEQGNDWCVPLRLRLRYGIVDGCVRWDLSAEPLIPLAAWSGGVELIPCSTMFPLASKRSAGCKTIEREVYNRAALELGAEPGAKEGLMLEQGGNVIETLRCNLLVFTGGEWVTPDLSYYGVHGVMRSWLMGKLPIKETSLDLAALKKADEVALCNSLRGVIPVVSLRGDRQSQYGSGVFPATARLQQLVAKELW
ncbi:aminotransferase class IV [Microbulbifer sp. SA54]|uniref:aminotransferase class IV n=1 Tax=Microbulbifer sp. SA54 TaxID=3401577 RepID=UPI003AAF6B5B